MCIFCFFVTIYLLFLTGLYAPYNKLNGIISYISIFCNLCLFLKTMFCDPGISPSIYMHYIKIYFNSGSHQQLNKSSDCDDLESGGTELT